MAQPLPSDADMEAIEEELQFIDVLIETLDTGADDYQSRLAELENQKMDYEAKLQSIRDAEANTRSNVAGPSHLGAGMDGADDRSHASSSTQGMAGPSSSAQRFLHGASSFLHHQGSKRPLGGAGEQYPSKRPTPDPSNKGSPTSSTGSFEWVDHPDRASKPPPPGSQYSRDNALARQRAAEAALKRQQEAKAADEEYARKLHASQNASRSASASGSFSRSNVQTTLMPGGTLAKPPPPPLLQPSQEPNLRSSQRANNDVSDDVKAESGFPKQKDPHSTSSFINKPDLPAWNWDQKVSPAQRSNGHSVEDAKSEPGFKQQSNSLTSPLTNRPKPSKFGVVDLTASDDEDDDDDVMEVPRAAFSPSNRRSAGPQSNSRPDRILAKPGPNRPGPAPVKPESQMPGAWPGGYHASSSANGYVYGQPQQPQDYLQPRSTNQASQYPRTVYNGGRTVGSDELDQMAELLTPSTRGPAAGPARGGPDPYGVGSSNPLGAVPGSTYGGGVATNHLNDENDDEVVYGGYRPRAPGTAAPGQPPVPGTLPAGYANQEAYRQQFDEIMNQNPAKTMEEINALMENIRPDEDLPEHLRVKTPEQMAVSLHKYQELGLTWLKRCEEGSNKGGILADDMGLGKTIQMLSLIVTRKSNDPRCKTTLIVAPVALMRQWKQEIETRLKQRYRLTVHVHHGQNRKKTFADLRIFDVVLTTFGTLTAELKKLEAFALRQRIDPAATPRDNEKCALLGPEARWYRVVLDEAQCIKNNSTQGAKAACRLRTTYRFCMTGTPMMNNVDELWSLICFLGIKPYNDRTNFQRDFTRRLKHEATRDPAMKHLQAVIRSLMLRRTKQSKFEGQPILTLPERTTTVDNPVFSDDEQAFYRALEERSALQYNKYLKSGTVGKSYSAILVLLLRLRQACCHPHLIKDFGVSAAAGVSPDDLIELAKQLAPQVVERIKATNGNFECPVCYDACPNPAIFVPCGHDTCQECFAKIADQAARNGEGGGATANAKCPNCRGEINSKNITDFESFKKVHAPDMLSEEDRAELLRMQEEFESDDSDDDDDSDEEEDEDEDDRGFVVPDDVIEYDTESDDDGGVKVSKKKGSKPAPAPIFRTPGSKGTEADVQAEEESETEDDLDITKKSAAKKGKGKKKAKDKPSKKSKKPKKDKGKGRKEEKQAKKKAAPKTLAELKKAASRSAKDRKAYMKKLKKDWVSSAKIEKTMDTLKEIMGAPEGEKILIFSQWTSLLDLLECPISVEGWGYRRYDGSMNADQRGNAVDDFRDVKKDVRIMLVSLKAGNAGLNLNMASRVIILDPFWNPYIEEQAIDRAHRIGQQRPVVVHRMLIENTVEDRIIALQEKKRQLISDALDEKASQSIARLGPRELAYLFGLTRRPDQAV